LSHLLLTVLRCQVGAELPIDSDEADEENKKAHGKTCLYVFGRGYSSLCAFFVNAPAKITVD
jgi:hypothetical protein